MIAHTTLPVGNYAKSKAFYSAVLATLGYRRVQARTRLQVGESPTEVKRLRPRSLGGTVAGNQDGGALRQHTLKRRMRKAPGCNNQ